MLAKSLLSSLNKRSQISDVSVDIKYCLRKSFVFSMRIIYEPQEFPLEQLWYHDAVLTTMTTATTTQVAEGEENCTAQEDGTVVCSGGGGKLITGGPGGGGRHTVEEPDGDMTISGGGGRPGSNEELVVNGGHCELEPGGDDGECVGEFNRYD